jgi:hypothetical protein
MRGVLQRSNERVINEYIVMKELAHSIIQEIDSDSMLNFIYRCLPIPTIQGIEKNAVYL